MANLAKARALAALKKAGIESLAAAARLSDDELKAIKGIGGGTIEMIRAVAGEGEESESTEAEDREKTILHLWDEVQALKEASGTETAYEDFYERYRIEDRAMQILKMLAEKQALSEPVVQSAWNMAATFEQEAKRATEGPIRVHDGMRVIYQGREMVLRTKVLPNETLPPTTRKCGLVPADD